MKTINDPELLQILEKEYPHLENGLLYGKAGLAIYYAELSNRDHKFDKIYNRLIQDILSSVSKNTPIELNRGLIGICLAIDLILHFYNKGNPENVLEDVIPEIYKSYDLSINSGMEKEDFLVEGFFFFSLHVKYGVKKKNMKEVFAQKAISLLEIIYSRKQYRYHREPLPGQILTFDFLFLYAICILYEQGYYMERINHICNEIIHQLLLSTPTLYFNRLVRLFLVSKISTTIHGLVPLWNEYSDFLVRLVPSCELFSELRDKQLCLNDGLTGVYYMIDCINRLKDKETIPVNWALYKERVEESSLVQTLNDFNEIPFYYLGINGLWGINYFLNKKIIE